MKKGGIVTIVIGLIILIFLGSLWSARNKAIKLQNQITAQYTSNKSNYDAMWKTFKENVQVTEIQAEQFKDAYDDLFAGRSNENLLFNAIKEQNPAMDSSVYTKLQDTITTNRKTFDKNQKTLLDMISNYNSYVQTSLLMQILQYDTLNPDDYIVLSSKTVNAFTTGQDDEINLLEK